jgi:hypothetical protein
MGHPMELESLRSGIAHPLLDNSQDCETRDNSRTRFPK